MCTNLDLRGADVTAEHRDASGELRVDQLSMAESTAWRNKARGRSQDADLLSTAGYDNAGTLGYLVLAVQTSRSAPRPSGGTDIGHSDRTAEAKSPNDSPRSPKRPEWRAH